MLKKRLIAGVAACLMAVSAFSMSASAYAWTDTIRVYKIKELILQMLV